MQGWDPLHHSQIVPWTSRRTACFLCSGPIASPRRHLHSLSYRNLKGKSIFHLQKRLPNKSQCSFVQVIWWQSDKGVRSRPISALHRSPGDAERERRGVESRRQANPLEASLFGHPAWLHHHSHLMPQLGPLPSAWSPLLRDLVHGAVITASNKIISKEERFP